MKRYHISKSFGWHGQMSDKVAAVMGMFGVTVEAFAEKSISVDCKLEINNGDVVYITGPSGSGKTTILNGLQKQIPACERVNLAGISLSDKQAVIDCIEGDLVQGLRLLSTAGLNDVFSLVNRPANLSDGQKYRFRLAMALSTKKKFIFADEFCSNLDRITAAVISYNIHKFAKRYSVTFILAGSHEDVLADLAADVLVVKNLSGPAEIIYKKWKKRR